MSTAGRVLLVCYGALGDLLLLLEAASTAYSDREVYVACTSSNAAAARTEPGQFLAGIATVDLRNPFALARLCRRWGVTKIIDSSQWANIGPLHCAVARALVRHVTIRGFVRGRAFVRRSTYDEPVEHSSECHELLNFGRLLDADVSEISGPDPQTDPALQAFVPRLYTDHPRDSDDTISAVILHCWPSGVRSYLKMWPERYWTELIREICAEDYEVLLSGGPVDRERCADLARRALLPATSNLAGQLSLEDLFHRFQGGDTACVSVNTGTMHLAALAGAPLVGLHGPTNPARWGPVGSSSVSLTPRSGNFAYLDLGHEYPASDDDAYAMDQLPVEAVLNALASLGLSRLDR